MEDAFGVMLMTWALIAYAVMLETVLLQGPPR